MRTFFMIPFSLAASGLMDVTAHDTFLLRKENEDLMTLNRSFAALTLQVEKLSRVLEGLELVQAESTRPAQDAHLLSVMVLNAVFHGLGLSGIKAASSGSPALWARREITLDLLVSGYVDAAGK